MITQIIRELTAIKRTNEITSEQVLFWSRRVQVQRAQKVYMGATKDNKEFNAIKGMSKGTMPETTRYKYCRSTHEPRWHPAYDKNWSKCWRVNHFERVCRCQGRQMSKDGRRERCRAVYDIQHEDKETKVAKQDFYVVRLKLFNFHSIR